MDQKPPAQYCSTCEDIFHGARNQGQTYEHHQDGEHLKQSASNGCQFCFFLWEMLTETERERMRKHADRPITTTSIPAGEVHSNPSTSYSITAASDGGYSMQYTFLGERYKDDRYSVVKTISFLLEHCKYISTQFSQLWLTNTAVAQRLPDEGAVLSSDVPSSVTLASQWVNRCETLHKKKCSESIGDNNFLPTRLIDVGDRDYMNPCLHITGGSPEPHGGTKYMTLSHCWGSIKPKKLETHNIKAMRQGIELSTLPKTFQDAIQITRTLGIRYIWIDTLCIIQDSPDDWFKESSLMCDIYANSYCNIAATAAKDGSVGCIYDRNPIIAHPLCIQATWTGLEPATYCLVDRNMWSREVDDAPLNQRAWVFQERFLSPRNLSFGVNRLFWECAELRACETFPGGLPAEVSSTAFQVSSPAALDKKHPPSRKTEGRKTPHELAAMKAWFLMATGAQLNLPLKGEFTSPFHSKDMTLMVTD